MHLPQLRRVRWAVRATLLLGVAASVTANILHALDNPISQAIAAWPPLALLLTVELISRVPVHRRSLAAARLVATATIAGIAAWVSYWHMAGVAAKYGETGASPYLMPLSVDGLIVVASICLVELSGRINTLERPAAPPHRADPRPAFVPPATHTTASDPATAYPATAPASASLSTASAATTSASGSLATTSASGSLATTSASGSLATTSASGSLATSPATARSGASTAAAVERAAATGALPPQVAAEIADLLAAKPQPTPSATAAPHAGPARTAPQTSPSRTAPPAVSGRTAPHPAPAPRHAGTSRPVAPAPAGRATPPGASIPELKPEATKQSRQPAPPKVRRSPAETIAEAHRIRENDPAITDSALAAALGISTARWRTIRRESDDRTIAA
ncbi:DUF2637 domain-containing protein [Actinoplanes sp. NPDC049265]|uniref:DUF2637 domain-containing protein n=1 Tax=Actinoplanes sp. NPDC049265 TaxID=3363902 RepID=UPI00371B7E8C